MEAQYNKENLNFYQFYFNGKMRAPDFLLMTRSKLWIKNETKTMSPPEEHIPAFKRIYNLFILISDKSLITRWEC